MPAAVAAPWQSDPDHPLVRLETAASGPGHAVSLQETPSDPCSTSATVILSRTYWICRRSRSTVGLSRYHSNEITGSIS